MEDFAGEEVSKKINMNLNTTPYWEKTYGKKQDYKIHKNVHFRGDIKIAGKEDDVLECKECHRILPLTAFTSHYIRADGAFVLKKGCRECHVQIRREQREIRKIAPPKPDYCDGCHKNKKLEIDHIHGSLIFRGWLCSNCNTGIGAVGDTLEGVLQAAIYLENDKDKIIETLNKIKEGSTDV